MNGENAQISFVYGCLWVVGSKNKTLLVGEEQELDGVKSKHEHKLTILIARSWFNLLKGLSEEMINELKEELSRYTLVGEYCNSENLQHLVDYGK